MCQPLERSIDVDCASCGTTPALKVVDEEPGAVVERHGGRRVVRQRGVAKGHRAGLRSPSSP